jgi:predicted transcriptional regulator
MSGKRYSAEQKQWALAQMSPPRNLSTLQLAKESGITVVSLRLWRQEARARGVFMPGSKGIEKWSGSEKFKAVLETASLSEAEISQYCRSKAIQVEHLQQWRRVCEQANGVAPVLDGAVENPTALQRIKSLEKELRRKDAALAEAAALLILRKKADAIWGQEEDE